LSFAPGRSRAHVFAYFFGASGIGPTT
jgi:hypothetical protein